MTGGSKAIVAVGSAAGQSIPDASMNASISLRNRSSKKPSANARLAPRSARQANVLAVECHQTAEEGRAGLGDLAQIRVVAAVVT